MTESGSSPRRNPLPSGDPKRLLVVGGGYIGLELGTAYRKLGSEVTILEGTDSLLPGVDPSLVRMVTRKLKKLGVTVVTGAMVQGGESSDDEVKVTAQVKGEEKTFAADVVLVAVGRKPNTDELGLEQVGIQKDERGFIKVDKQLQHLRSAHLRHRRRGRGCPPRPQGQL